MTTQTLERVREPVAEATPPAPQKRETWKGKSMFFGLLALQIVMVTATILQVPGFLDSVTSEGATKLTIPLAITALASLGLSPLVSMAHPRAFNDVTEFYVDGTVKETYAGGGIWYALAFLTTLASILAFAFVIVPLAI